MSKDVSIRDCSPLLGAFVGVNMVINIQDLLAVGVAAVVDEVAVLLRGSIGSGQILDTVLLKLLHVLGQRLPVGLDVRLALGCIVAIPAWC